MTVEPVTHPAGGGPVEAALMVVADWNTTCSACGFNVDAAETHHRTILAGYPTRHGQPAEGCGARFVGMVPSPSARIVPGCQPCGHIAVMRPDLPVLPRRSEAAS